MKYFAPFIHIVYAVELFMAIPNFFRSRVIHYSSEAPTVKILPEGRNPTQSKKTVDRDAYLKFANQNFKEFDVEEDDDEDLDNIGEKQPVLKTFKGRDDEEGLIGDTV
jgi:hypothetical protein